MVLRHLHLHVQTLAPLLLAACSVDATVILDGGGGLGDDDFGEGTDTDEGDSSQGEPGEGEDGESGQELDLPGEPIPTPAPACSLAADQLDGALPCELEAPSEIIAPVTAWTWSGQGSEDSVVVTPLVANLTDDNLDGFVDVCDRPDVVVAAVDLPADKTGVWPAGHLYIVDGELGETHLRIPTPIDAAVNPALGDLDGDGVAEIVALQANGLNSPYDLTERRLVAFHANGELFWAGTHWRSSRGGGAVAIADLDGDGSPEILAPGYVATAEGELAWAPSNPAQAYSMPVAVDLDLDGDLEVLFGGTAYAHDGEHLFDSYMVPRDRGSVAVANFDDDPEPELYIQHDGQHAVFEHDGAFKALCPASNANVGGVGGYPVTIRDLDGDDQAELVFGFQDTFYVLAITDGDCSLRWSRKADNLDGLSSGTVFDLLGDGEAETITTDRSHVRLYSSTGELLFQTDHRARESIANPVVADVDGDGAAEILIAASEPEGGGDLTQTPTLVLLQNADDRFAPARRVWNQHTYHHSNISELGRVPEVETPHWQVENAFRTNRQAFGSDQCIPPALQFAGP